MIDKFELFKEIDIHLMEDAQPSLYINQVSHYQSFKEYPFDYIDHLKDTEQFPKYHPEGSVWNHTMLVVDEGAKVRTKAKDPRAFMWASLLHDIGKPDTTKKRKGRITSYDHDILGAKLSELFLRQFTQDEVFIEKVRALVRWHMQLLFVINKLPFADVGNMKKDVDLSEISLLFLCDRLGRVGAELNKEKQNIKKFLELVRD